jgi:hypothetical protein
MEKNGAELCCFERSANAAISPLRPFGHAQGSVERTTFGAVL